VTLYLLDTNIVSMLDPRRREHAPELVDWLERNGASLFLSVMTVTELDAGVHKLRREGNSIERTRLLVSSRRS
jgi:toxin FitB